MKDEEEALLKSLEGKTIESVDIISDNEIIIKVTDGANIKISAHGVWSEYDFLEVANG